MGFFDYFCCVFFDVTDLTDYRFWSSILEELNIENNILLQLYMPIVTVTHGHLHKLPERLLRIRLRQNHNRSAVNNKTIHKILLNPRYTM